MRNLVWSVGLNKPYDLFLDKKMCVTTALKGQFYFKKFNFTHEDNLVTDVMAEISAS